ncbi:hypothetical protein ACJRO7_031927 [Eucalyptus globulus]|uniref:Uncharacterized protein n=1 Tax=Eucalyptus globulus TaxID=34317 RepID=A0ABD3JLN3_EUCGL
MVVGFPVNEISKLCLGKPVLRCLSATSAAIGDALSALQRFGGTTIGPWSCYDDDDGVDDGTPSSPGEAGRCVCVGKVCTVDIVCFLCREENLANLVAALRSKVAASSST